MCGFTREDVEATLHGVCGEAYEKHLSAMTEYFNGYHFCNNETVSLVYNMEICLSYLQSLIDGRNLQLEDPENSEVSEQIFWFSICHKGLSRALKLEKLYPVD